MKSSIFTILAFLSISLASCSKDNGTKPVKLGDDLTGTAKEVFDLVWDMGVLNTSNHCSIGSTIEFLNTTSETGEIITFEPTAVSAFSSTELVVGDGIKLSSSNEFVTIVKNSDTHFPNQLLIRCYKNGEKLMGTWYNY